jgi:hypothetical protein
VYRNSLVSVKDSHTEILDLSDFNGRLLCDFMSVSRLYGYNVNATLTGSLRINDPHLISWPVLQQQSRLKREYSVATVYEDVFAQGVKLSLMNGNRTLWSGTTDSSGKSYFNVTYYHIWRLGMGVWADDNSTLTLTLTAKLGDEMHVSNVTVETSSPIVFSFDKQPEPPIWGNRYTLLVAGGIIITATLVFYFSKIRRRVVSLH